MRTQSALRTSAIRQVVTVCHRLAARGFVAATDGNVSIRLKGGTILTTRTAVAKGCVTTRDILELDRKGVVLKGRGRPSTEVGMHLFIYEQRPDVRAVVHAHPVYATAFATARIPLDACLFPEVIVDLGVIPLARYATPSTREVAESIAPHVRSAQAILLSNHGVVTYGADMDTAYLRMEKVEHAAHITFLARLLGGEQALTPEELERLRRISVVSYGKDLSGSLACRPDTDRRHEMTEQEVRAYIERRLKEQGTS